MTESIVHGLNKARPAPQNQSIGKNGSFWLPKDTASLEASHKGQKTIPKKSVLSEKRSSNLPKNFVDSKSDTQGKASFEKTILTAEKKIVPQNLRITGKLFNSKSLNITKQISVKSNLSTNIFNSNSKTSSEAKQHISVAVSKEFTKPIIPKQITNRSIQKDGSRDDSEHKKKNRGTNNASKVASMDENPNKSFNTVVTESPVFHSDPSFVSKFSSLIGKSIAPRVAYTNKFAKKVVRFAIDLANGGKLGVRLEKSAKGISLCFIAPQNEIQSLLNICRESIESNVKSESNSDVSFHVFSDYQEMDNYFRKVA